MPKRKRRSVGDGRSPAGLGLTDGVAIAPLRLVVVLGIDWALAPGIIVVVANARSPRPWSNRPLCPAAENESPYLNGASVPALPLPLRGRSPSSIDVSLVGELRRSFVIEFAYSHFAARSGGKDIGRGGGEEEQ